MRANVQRRAGEGRHNLTNLLAASGRVEPATLRLQPLDPSHKAFSHDTAVNVNVMCVTYL